MPGNEDKVSPLCQTLRAHRGHFGKSPCFIYVGTTRWHKKKWKLLKCVVAAMYSWQHCGTWTLSYRLPRHLVTMDQWNGRQRAVAITFSYMFGFLQFLLGVSKVPIFLCHLVVCGWALWPVKIWWRRKKLSVLAGNWSLVFKSVATDFLT
jgi:hypothetical protein